MSGSGRIGRFCLLLTVSSLLLASGCYYAVLQTPDTLPAGKVQVDLRVGGAYMYYRPESLSMFFPSDLGLGARVGLARRLDAGIAFSPFLTGLIDVKYRFCDRPVRLAADIGLSSGAPIDVGFDSNDRMFTTSFCPAVIAGGESWYAGARLMYSLTRHVDFHSTHISWQQGAFVGGSFGHRLRLLPELDLYVPLNQSYEKIPNSVKVSLTVGLQFRL
jgi:hypothetical protein